MKSIKIKEGYEIKDLPLIPCGYRLLIRQELKAARSAEGIYYYGDEESKRQQKGYHFGEVIAMGPEAYDKPNQMPWCDVGDIVRFKPYQGASFQDPNDVNEDGTHWHVMNDIDIIGVIPNKENS